MNYLKYFVVIFLLIFISETLQANQANRGIKRGRSSISNSKQQKVRPSQQLVESIPQGLTHKTRPTLDLSVSPRNHDTLPQIETDITTYDLIEVVLKDDLEQARNLVTAGLDVNVQDDPIPSMEHSEMRQPSWTPLMYAIYTSHFEMTKLLVMLGADINKPDHKGMTALMLAAQYNDLPTIDFLVRSGAKIDLQDDFGATADSYAHRGNNYNLVIKTVRFLAGLRSFIENRTSLMFASYRGDIKAVQSLVIVNEGDINARDKNGWTALMIARFEGHLEIAGFLSNNIGARFTSHDHEILIDAEAKRQSGDEIH